MELKTQNIELTNQPLDNEDLLTVLRAIFRQTIDDYIKLQHPRYRHKTYLQEAFDDAVDTIFDEEYRFLYLKNDDGDYMSLKDMLQTMLKKQKADINQLKEYVVNEAIAFWETKFIRTLYIPSTLLIDGHVYRVVQGDDPTIDFENKILYMDMTNESEKEEEFIQLLTKIMAYHSEIKVKSEDLDAFAKTLFRTLKMNTCFTGDYTSKASTGRKK